MIVCITGELHQDEWGLLLKDAEKYTNLQCGVAGEDLAEWIVFHAKDLKAVFDKHKKAGSIPGASAAGNH